MTFKTFNDIPLHGVDLERLVNKIPSGTEYYLIYCRSSDEGEWEPHKVVFTEFEMKHYVDVLNGYREYQHYSMSKMIKN